MKKISLLTILLVVFIACTTDNTDLSKKQVEKWQLVQITGTQTQAVSTGNQMEFQEEFTIYRDSIFTKSRSTNSNLEILTGTYNYMTYNGEKYLVLSYTENNSMIGNCSNNLKEVLKFTSETELTNTWMDCDGPKLDYEKVND